MRVKTAGTSLSKFHFFHFLVILAAIASAGCGLFSNGSNQIQRKDEPFSGEKAYAHVLYLANDIGARPSSSQKARLAADYIAKQFRLQKLDVSQPGYEYPMYTEKKVELEVVEPTVEKLHVNSLTFSAAAEAKGELVNAGEGEPADFDAVDAKDKIVLMKRGGTPFSAKVDNAAKAGATGVIIFNNTDGELKGTLGRPAQIPAVAITFDDGWSLLTALKQGPVTVHILVDAEISSKSDENVVGTRRGKSKKIVILSAHYDTVEDGPGANDNASGVATVIEMARVTTSRSYPFELRFIAFGGEELGLFGSEHYVQSLRSDELDNLVAVINFDMVGVGDQVKFGGSAELMHEAEAVATELEIVSGELEKRYATASDHASFMEAGIPALMINWEEDSNYHTANDKAEFVKPDILETTGKLALRVLDKLAK